MLCTLFKVSRFEKFEKILEKASVGVHNLLIFSWEKHSTTDGFPEICEVFQNGYNLKRTYEWLLLRLSAKAALC